MNPLSLAFMAPCVITELDQGAGDGIAGVAITIYYILYTIYYILYSWGSDYWPRLLADGGLLAVSNKATAGGENNYSLKFSRRPQHPTTPFLWGRAINFTRIFHHTLAKGTWRLSGKKVTFQQQDYYTTLLDVIWSPVRWHKFHSILLFKFTNTKPHDKS